MFSTRKYFCCLAAGFLSAVLFVIALPAEADTFVILLYITGCVSLILKGVHASGSRFKAQSDVLFSGLTDFQTVNKMRFAENDARVRELSVLVRQVEGAVAGLGELQGVKFDENEGRVRGLGVLVRKVEGAVADLAQTDQDGRLTEIERRATAELRFRALDDLATIRQMLEDDKELVCQPDSYGS